MQLFNADPKTTGGAPNFNAMEKQFRDRSRSSYNEIRPKSAAQLKDYWSHVSLAPYLQISIAYGYF